MLIEKIPIWSKIFIYGFFLAFVLLAIVGGLFGPQVWTYIPLSSWQCPDNQPYFDANDCLGSDIAAGRCYDININRRKINSVLSITRGNVAWKDQWFNKNESKLPFSCDYSKLT